MNERERVETEDLAAELAEALTWIRVLERKLGDAWKTDRRGISPAVFAWMVDGDTRGHAEIKVAAGEYHPRQATTQVDSPFECPACGWTHTAKQLEESGGECPQGDDESWLCSGGSEDAPCGFEVGAEGDLCGACLRDRQARERGAK